VKFVASVNSQQAQGLAMSPLLDIRNLTTRFHTREGIVHAVNGVSYSLGEGDILGLVGESGCGKSVSMLSVMRLIPGPAGRIESGEVLFRGRDLLKLSESNMESVRGAEIAMIFQDPMTSLNPTLTIGFQIAEVLMLHQRMSRRQADERSADLLALVGIPGAKDRLKDYPHQFSGGMRQRAMIAMALSCNPRLLIADEPTTALDVTVQAQIVELVKRLQGKLGMTVVWITHDLGVVARLVERVIVMYAGYVVEDAPVDDLFAAPRHPYTLGLLGSLPDPNAIKGTRLSSIPGQPPSLTNRLLGCPFAPRCAFVAERCRQENPVLETVGADHRAACWEHRRTEGARRHVR
jgi:oligopeptide transport system ATP-binding protein